MQICNANFIEFDLAPQPLVPRLRPASAQHQHGALASFWLRLHWTPGCELFKFCMPNHPKLLQPLSCS